MATSKQITAFAHTDHERSYLQIELKNDRGILLSFPHGPNGDPPRVTLWTGSGDHTFGHQTPAQWREWLDCALGGPVPASWLTPVPSEED